MKKNWIAVLAILVLVLGAYSLFEVNRGTKETKTIKIGISQIVPNIILDSVRQEIINTLAENGYKEGENLTIDYQNAQGDMSINQSIAQKFADSDYDLFVGITTPTTQAIANVIKDRPVVFAAVSDSVKAGLVKDLQHPGGNVTGTSDITLYEQQLDLIKKIKPSVKTIGILYNPSEDAAQSGLEQAQKYAPQFGLEIVTVTVNTSNDVLVSARSIVDKVDAFYIIPDSTVVSGQDALIKVAIENKKPLFAYEESGVEKGALATLSTNYAELGKRTGEIIVQILEGENPAEIPVIGVTSASLFINTTTAEKIGITFSDEQLAEAKQIYK